MVPENENLRIYIEELEALGLTPVEVAINVDPSVYEGVEHGAYNAFAERYKGNELTADLVSIIEEQVSDKSAAFLDIAAGTGRTAKLLVEKGYTNITAFDLHQNMLDALANTGIHTAQGNMNERFGFADNSFDAAYTLWSNRFMENPLHIAQETHRVLKDDGIFVWPIFINELRVWQDLSRRENPITIATIVGSLEFAGFKNITLHTPEFPMYPNYTNPPVYLVAKK